MSGNLYEWCFDWYGSDYYGISPASNPSGPALGAGRMRRGGFWDNSSSALFLRGAHRGSLFPYSRAVSMGFRLVRTAQ